VQDQIEYIVQDQIEYGDKTKFLKMENIMQFVLEIFSHPLFKDIK